MLEKVLIAAIVIYPDNLWYIRVNVDDVKEIFEKSILKNDVVKRLMPNKDAWKDIKKSREIKKVERITYK